MTTPRPAVAWIVVVVSSAVTALSAALLLQERSGLDIWLAVVLGFGAAVASLLPIRYRIGGSTSAVTADEAFLVALLIALPGAWPPLILALGVAAGNLARRKPAPTPPIRILFNFGSVGLSASLASVTYHFGSDTAAPLAVRSLVMLIPAMAVYAVVSGAVIAVLFSRLGISSFRKGIADVLPVSRVNVPANLVGGLALGWLASQGSAFAVVGVGMVLVLFVSFRVSLGAQQQRDRAGRLRDVATSLVGASGSFEAFDTVLERIALLFGAHDVELLLATGEHRRFGDGLDVVGRSPAADAGMGLSSAQVFAPGTPEGGNDGALVAPVVEDGVHVGALVVHGRQGLESWDDADQDVLDGVAGEVLVALHNAELLRQVAAERSRLAAQSELLGGILTAASDGIALLSVGGEVLAWNPAMSTLTAQHDASVVGRRWSEVLTVAEEGRSNPLADAVASAATGLPQARTWRVVRPDEEDRWVRAQLTASTAGDEAAVVVVLRDVTASREVDRLKADFIATVSHELRTPLTPLKGFLELTQKRQLEPAQQAAMNVSMLRQVERLETLVEDLLSVAQLDRAMVDLAEIELSLEGVLATVAESYQGNERVAFEAADCSVVGDEEAIVRIIDALVNNAMKHTDGSVHVRTRSDAGVACVDVVDVGQGIPVSEQEAIFESFHRLGDHLHRTQGPGLGLPIARALARRLGGDVTVRSTPGQGSTFTARFTMTS